MDSNLWVKIAATAAVILTDILLCLLSARLFNRVIDDLDVRHRTRKAAIYIINVSAAVVLIIIWVGMLRQIYTIIGLSVAGIIVALSSAVLCIAGWLFLIIRRPFDIGDRIQFGETCGDVIDIRLFQVSLLEVGNWVGGDQSTGRMVFCPNSGVFSKDIFNYTKGFPFIWDEISAQVTFESDWKRGKEIMLEQAESESEKITSEVERLIDRMTRKYPIRYHHLTPIVYTSIAESGVLLTLRYLTNVRARRSSRNRIFEQILERFAEESNVKLAYPTQRITGVGESK